TCRNKSQVEARTGHVGPRVPVERRVEHLRTGLYFSETGQSLRPFRVRTALRCVERYARRAHRFPGRAVRQVRPTSRSALHKTRSARDRAPAAEFAPGP